MLSQSNKRAKKLMQKQKREQKQAKIQQLDQEDSDDKKISQNKNLKKGNLFNDSFFIDTNQTLAHFNSLHVSKLMIYLEGKRTVKVYENKFRKDGKSKRTKTRSRQKNRKRDNRTEEQKIMKLGAKYEQ